MSAFDARALAPHPSMQKRADTMTTSSSPMDLFVRLSAILTGIDADRLAPDIDPVDIKQTYFDTAQKNGGETFVALLNIFAQHQAEPAANVGDIILNQSGPSIRFLARSIMLAWYLGSWYRPQDLQDPPAAGPIPSTVISSQAYTQGWAWRVAQAHPMGYSDFTFGYWASNPPALSDFVKGD